MWEDVGNWSVGFRENSQRAVKDLDGIAGADAQGKRQKANGGRVRPATAVVLLLGLAVLCAALSLLVMGPAARHLRSFQDGERVPATLRTSGSCMLGHCQVEFEANGRRVAADLPAGSGGGKSPAGTRLTVRYHTDDPHEAVREEDVGGGGAAALAVMSDGAALFFLVLSAVALVHVLRQRHTDPAARRARQERRRRSED